MKGLIELTIGKIEIPKKITSLNGGPIGISFKFKIITNNGSVENKEDIRTNVVWFSEDYLLENGFDSKLIINTLSLIYFNKTKLSALGINMYHDIN